MATRSSTEPDVSTRGRTEPLASLIEHQARMGLLYSRVVEQIERLPPDRWIVAGPGYVERWHVGATVVGSPGIFLIWPIAGAPAPALWNTAQSCRRYVHQQLGGSFDGAVEVVFHQPQAPRDQHDMVGSGWMEREMASGNAEVEIVSADYLSADGNNLDVLLAAHEPPAGTSRLSEQWIAELRERSTCRWTVRGPDEQARLLPAPVFETGE